MSDEVNDMLVVRGALDEFKLVGTGGMSQVFRARQLELGRNIAIKKLKEEFLNNNEVRERFRREAKSLASVLHQNIAHVYDFIDTPHESYILMEYIDGIDLSTIIEKIGRLPLEVAALIILSVAKGVEYIHSHNLIHRDIKPSNIRITPRGEVKLMDFGIALDVDSKSLTRPGMMVGSPHYLSPEQVLGDPITPQSDLFLMGICLYEMICGVRPFKDDLNSTVFQNIRECNFIPVSSIRFDVPKKLERIIIKCLKKNLKNRYQSVKQLIIDLEDYLGFEKTSHCEEIIVHFLDTEALLEVLDLPKSKSIKKKKTLPLYLLGLIITFFFLVGFFAAYKVGFTHGQKNALKVIEHYGPPKKIK